MNERAREMRAACACGAEWVARVARRGALSHWLRGTHFRPRRFVSAASACRYSKPELLTLRTLRAAAQPHYYFRMWDNEKWETCVSRFKFTSDLVSVPLCLVWNLISPKLQLPLDVKWLFFLIFVKHSREITRKNCNCKYLNLNRVFDTLNFVFAVFASFQYYVATFSY